MTRRTFQKQAALFVAGCALQVCGVLPKLKVAAPELVKAVPNPAWETANAGNIEFIWCKTAYRVVEV